MKLLLDEETTQRLVMFLDVDSESRVNPKYPGKLLCIVLLWPRVVAKLKSTCFLPRPLKEATSDRRQLTSSPGEGQTLKQAT